MYCIAKDTLPISTVEKECFKRLINLIDPGTLYLAANISHTTLPKLYAECRENVEEQLKTDLTYFATTTDLWCSRMSEPYISITIHYIDRVESSK